jgi:hypothetical protein
MELIDNIIIQKRKGDKIQFKQLYISNLSCFQNDNKKDIFFENIDKPNIKVLEENDFDDEDIGNEISSKQITAELKKIDKELRKYEK